jgi:hypothetical protein
MTWKHDTHLTFSFAFLSAWLLSEFLTGLKCTLDQDGKQFNIGRGPRIFNIWHINKMSQKLMNMLPFSTCEASLNGVHGQQWRNRAQWFLGNSDDRHSHQHLKIYNIMMFHNMYEHDDLMSIISIVWPPERNYGCYKVGYIKIALSVRCPAYTH